MGKKFLEDSLELLDTIVFVFIFCFFMALFTWSINYITKVDRETKDETIIKLKEENERLNKIISSEYYKKLKENNEQ